MKKPKKSKKTKLLRIKNKFYRFFLISLIWGFTLLLLYSIYIFLNLPDFNKILVHEKIRHIQLVDVNGQVIYNSGDIHAGYVKFKDIPKDLINGVLAIEDKRFYRHKGIDFIGLSRAIFTNIKLGRKAQGASTISQQLAKITYLTSEKSYERKLKEFFLTLYIERNFNKNQIITEYLNRAYFGCGIYGISAAARYYYNKPIYNLKIKEFASLAGMLKAPNNFSPLSDNDSFEKRANLVLKKMYDNNFINESEYYDAIKTNLDIDLSMIGSIKNSYFSSWIVEEVNRKLPNIESDLIVETTLNDNLQKKSEHAAYKYINANNVNATQAAIVMLDKTGAVLSMVGGIDFFKSQFNRAVQSKRQPGSAFKHIIYINALESGFQPNDEVIDQPITISGWSPANYNKNYIGKTTIKDGFANSINTIAVYLNEKSGRSNSIKIAKKLNINSKLANNPSIALGTSEVSLLELTNSYNIISNNGYKVEPYGIVKIKNLEGKVLYSKNDYKFTKILTEDIVNNMKILLSEVVKTGTGKTLGHNLNYYGKTGTSQNYKDAWFIGFNDYYTTGVWVGNDDNSPMKKVTGSNIPLKIWQEIYK